ncbi:hypothetical protein [Marinifilum sp.]|uniref:hypothetical protein n=1 Tax=Marinifilum sp. TaxID=2033137 RepID=UPI003BABC174
MKIIKKIKPLLLLEKNKKMLHYNNLQGGEKIKVDGKEYVKVQFKLVDSLDKNSAGMMDNLETENELLNKQNKELSAKVEELNTKVELYQQLNHNLIDIAKQKPRKFTTSSSLMDSYKNELRRLNKKAKSRIKQIRQLVQKVEKLKQNLDKERYQSHLLRQRIRNMEKEKQPLEDVS